MLKIHLQQLFFYNNDLQSICEISHGQPVCRLGVSSTHGTNYLLFLKLILLMQELSTLINYPTALRRVQITPKTSTNITRYLYSRGPVRKFSRKARATNKIPFRFAYFCHDFPVNNCPHGHNNLACWIINLLLNVLLCSITENFYLSFVLWLPQRAHQNTAQLVKILSDSTQENV